MSKSDSTKKSAQGSLYKIWKFKKIELIKDPTGRLSSVATENYDLWDLTKKDTLIYSIKDSAGVTHSASYKIVDNAIVLQFPNNENNTLVKFKISELTANKLKLTLHVTYFYEGKSRDKDIFELFFDEQK